jgi:hypothetical protein
MRWPFFVAVNIWFRELGLVLGWLVEILLTLGCPVLGHALLVILLLRLLLWPLSKMLTVVFIGAAVEALVLPGIDKFLCWLLELFPFLGALAIRLKGLRLGPCWPALLPSVEILQVSFSEEIIPHHLRNPQRPLVWVIHFHRALPKAREISCLVSILGILSCEAIIKFIHNPRFVITHIQAIFLAKLSGVRPKDAPIIETAIIFSLPLWHCFRITILVLVQTWSPEAMIPIVFFGQHLGAPTEALKIFAHVEIFLALGRSEVRGLLG